MYDRVLKQMRERIRLRKYVMIIHAEEEMNDIVCDNCGKLGAKIRHVSKSYGKGTSLFVIENVPVVSCPHCSESYLTAETLHELERIKRHRQALAVLRPVPVAVFA